MARRRHETKSKRAYREYDERRAEIESEKTALRRNSLTGREIVALRPDSKEWISWIESFFSELTILKKNKVHSAAQISSYFAKKGFRTIGGTHLTPRLVSLLRGIGRDKLRSLRPSHSGTYEFRYIGGDIAFDLRSKAR
jgi:hypothetical protein